MNFIDKVDTLLDVCPGVESSGNRTRVHNQDVGGSWDSMHQLKDLAKDIVLDYRDRDLRLFMRMAVRLGLFVYDEGDHIHIHEMFPNGMIWNG